MNTEKSRPTILIVDDDDVDRMALKRLCSKVDAQIVEASSGEEALRIAGTLKNLALILIDVQMPSMDGFEATSKLKQTHQTQHTPVIFITGMNDKKDSILKGYSAGAVDYITKPFIAEILLSKVLVFLDMWQLRAELESVSAARNQFFSYMTHEIRAPMSGVLGLMTLLDATELNAIQRQYISTALNSSQLLLTIVNDILDFSKLDVGKTILEHIPFDLELLGKDVLQLLMVNKQNEDVALTFDYPSNTPRHFLGDPTRIRQILINLVSNALKFTLQGSVRLNITPTVTDGKNADITIAVIDTGIGIAEEQQKQIFNSFSQANTSISRTYGGSGLGLAICKKLANLMGGEIDVQSEINQGSIFSVNLVLPLSTTLNNQQSDNSTTGVIDQEQPQFKGHILLVEDTAINQIVTIAMLEILGLNVTLVENGLQALEAWRNSHFDLILMDYNLQFMNGLETIRNIRQEERPNVRIPIVGQTADISEDLKAQYQLAGADEFITKPFELDELIRIFRRFLEPKKG